ncbi:uncharacterized protein BDZ83DRAFT_766090 [Colletotrichum acutatum]|uniref:TauD/TfdA-like domain-containing protein n=1 Tax=Glomerella acutata TaxID=27357 RepID=A0AAD8UBX3_GLOAC|nr:uncharacterized protein BDZ83DRAFT_766090 [Colletotrichum acutatum]KAK1710859.1 hypothetical protein BDZ83DRAFT_766090 [Colletotrichum acutatum]
MSTLWERTDPKPSSRLASSTFPSRCCSVVMPFARAVRENFRDHIRLSIHPFHRREQDLHQPSSHLFLLHHSLALLDRLRLSGAIHWTPRRLRERPQVRALSEVNSPVVMRGFTKTKDRELFVKKSEEFGTPLPWKFGLVLEVKDQGADTRGLNNVLSAEWMPFHFDGLFKTHKVPQADGTEKLLPNPPKLLFQNLPPHLSVDRLRELTWSVQTSSFDSTKMGGLPLVVDHPTTGEPCIRYHEPWPQSKTAFDATDVVIEGVRESESTEICNVIDSLLHDRRNTLYFTWQQGDLLVSDNILAMHTRSDFTAGSPREMWRIHFD